MQANKGVIDTDVLSMIQDSVLTLPTLPTVFVAILEQITSENASAEDVARIIERDQSLTARVLAVANSAYYGFQTKISTVPRAVALLGFGVIKNLALSVSVFDDFLNPIDIVGFDKARFWEHSLVCAAVAREIAEQTKISAPDELYVAGLLHDIGKVALDVACGELYRDLLKQATEGEARSLVLEQNILGIDHAEVAGMLSQRWNLPDSIAAAICNHHKAPLEELSSRQQKMTAALAIADLISWTQDFGSINALRPPFVDDQTREILDINSLDIEKIRKAMDLQIITTAQLFDLSIPDIGDFRDALMKANVELGRINCLYEEAKHKLERQVNELSCLNRAVYQIRNDLDATEIVKALLKAIRDELGFSRAMLFRIGGENNEFYLADCITETGISADYEKLSFVPKKDTLLSSTLEQNRVARFTKTAKWESEPLFAYLETDKITVIPIVTKRGYAGVVTADNCQQERPLSIGSIDLLSILAHETGLAVDNALLFEKTKQLAARDELTDLYNRRYCLQFLKSEIERSKRYENPLSIVMFDVDHFKAFNDTYGHQTGDKILRTVALYLLSASRESDIIGRFGGEEFLVILPETPAEGAKEYAERVRLSIEEFGKTNAEGFGQTNLTISAGVAGYNPNWNTLESFLELADQALYSAKRNGRNQVAVF